MTSHLMTTDTILLDIEAVDKADVIHSICAQLFLLKRTDDPSALCADIEERENVVSTFAGCSTAIPHTITKHVKEPVLCFARVRDPNFTWNNADEEVSFVLLLAAPFGGDLRKLRLSQSYVFASVAQLISEPSILDLWGRSNNKEEILESFTKAFAVNQKTITI